MLNKCSLRYSLFFVVIVGLMIFQIFGLKIQSFGMGSDRVPTAIVVDAETGEPIEGAVAIAIWRKHSITERAWFEGGTMVVVRIEEAVSDKEGKIYIDDFWDWHLSENRYPRLTIYKPRYVCWDQKNIHINEYKGTRRHDFDKENRIAHMKKWPKGFSFNGHRRFMSSVTMRDTDKASKKLFRKAFEYEGPYQINENTRRDKEREEERREK
jgi:hypothetical protein